jgi:hypothetical protein
MASRSRASFEKRSRERNRQKKREDKLQRRQERRDARELDPTGAAELESQQIDMEGLFGYGGREPEAESKDESPAQE